MLPHAPRTSFLIRDWEGCTTATNELPNPNQRSVVKTSGFLHPYIYRYTARVPRDRFLAFEGEGMTWMRQPSRQGIALFSVRMVFWRDTVSRCDHCGKSHVVYSMPDRDLASRPRCLKAFCNSDSMTARLSSLAKP